MDSSTCKVCGRGPAARFVIRRHVGMLLLLKFVKIDAILCREHAIATVQQFQRQTLVQGWWGVTSFFFNIAAVVGNLSALSRAKKMAPASASVTPAILPDPVPSGWD
jgi:hypothetical protein